MKLIAYTAIVGTLIGLFSACSQAPVDPGPSQNGGITMKAGTELEGAQISVVSAAPPATVPKQTIEAGDSSVAFTGLEPGQYTVSVTMPDGRCFSTVVVVEPGQTYDLGEVAKLDSTEVKAIWHDPVVNYPSFIAWHYPMPNERVVFAQDSRLGLEIGRALSITFQFTKPMQRTSVQQAFAAAPAVDGAFTWSYAPAYRSTGEPYAIKSDNAMFVESPAVGSDNPNMTTVSPTGGSAGSPAMPPEPVGIDTNLVYGFTYHIPDEEILLDTTYSVTISLDAKDSAGESIGADYRFYFFVVPAPSPYPYLVTNPSMPVSTQSVILQLVLGMSQSACDPIYSSSFTVSGKDIRLAYQEIQTDMACIMIAVDPHAYGPTFTLGRLEPGEYRVFGPDSQFVGAFSVSRPSVVSGTVLEMEDPSIVHIRAPVLPGVVITAESNSWGYDYMYMPASSGSEVVTDTSDADGRFSLELPQSYFSYKITAMKDGYYPQVLFWNAYNGGVRMLASGATAIDSIVSELAFALIDTSAKPLSNLTVNVTRNGVAAESAYVHLSGGEMWAVGPMPAMETTTGSSAGSGDAPVSSRDVNVSNSYWGFTGADGKLTLNNILLTPHIDFTYTVSDREGAYTSGEVRLNAFAPKNLLIELPEPAVSPDSTVSWPDPFPATR